MLKQIPVVARDLDDLTVRVKVEAPDHHLAVAPHMLDPTCRETGKIKVVAEDCVWRLELFKL